MATLTPEAVPSERSRFSIWTPRPLWIGLAAVVLLGMGAGLRVGLPIYWRQVAICDIERLGGSASIGGRVHVRLRPGPWLRNRLGSKRVKVLWDEVSTVSLQRSQVKDCDLVHLKWLTNLGQLDLSGTQISDEGLVQLKSMTSLRQLDLQDTRVTTECVAELQRALPKTRIYKLGHPLVPAL
jgi:hypothetical protein